MANFLRNAMNTMVVSAGLCFALPAAAQAADGKNDAVATSRAATPASLKKLDDGNLSEARGGQAVVVGKQSLTSTVTGSTINGNYTAGTIVFSGSALSGFSGMGNITVNSGAQANLQSAMNLTVNLGK